MTHEERLQLAEFRAMLVEGIRYWQQRENEAMGKGDLVTEYFRRGRVIECQGILNDFDEMFFYEEDR